MYSIPTSIMIKDKQFNIRNKGDFRMVLDCFVALGDSDMDKTERVMTALIIFYEDINSLEDFELFPDIETAIQEMFRFFNCGQEHCPGANTNYKLIDWEKDEQLICSAVNKVAGKEIRLEPYVHWWTFMGWYNGVGESSLATVVTIRNKMANDKQLEKYEREFKRDNPQYFMWDSRTVEMQEADKLAKELWNSNKK